MKNTVQNSDDYQKIIDDWKNGTYYFDGFLGIDEMCDMFRNKGFGEAETQIIMASLMFCGAKF